MGLKPCQPAPWRHNLTEQDGAAAPIPDLVARDFTATRPGQKFVGDITYIPTWQGWLFLATVIDCYSKKIVGYATGDNYKTPLIIAAIRSAQQNGEIIDQAIFHTDYAGFSLSRGTVRWPVLARPPDRFLGLTFGAIGGCRGLAACLR
jgi:transposase InsO family protein